MESLIYGCCLFPFVSDAREIVVYPFGLDMLCCGVNFAAWSDVCDHIRSTTVHADCKRCRKGFNDLHSLQQHLRDSARHSTPLPRAGSFIDPSGVVSPQSGEPPSADATAPSRSSPYQGIAGSLIRPVFRKACALRFTSPSVEDLIHQSRTRLHIEIVSAILEAALRLLPSDRTLEGTSIRKTAEAAKAARAREAETAFVGNVRAYHSRLMDEDEQKQAIRAAINAGKCDFVKATPDILFEEPITINGTKCSWIEYKNTFGFKDNPFVHGKHKQQLRRYINTFGDGMVVYKLGFECNLMRMNGLSIQREADIIDWLQAQKPL